ncbi:hypothetical protein BU15DRAFT_76415 [Melanogaster broomeanus]|nr:hypothetical protein BU15DRAFT_76415 [Melanogaster broomeanus]
MSRSIFHSALVGNCREEARHIFLATFFAIALHLSNFIDLWTARPHGSHWQSFEHHITLQVFVERHIELLFPDAHYLVCKLNGSINAHRPVMSLMLNASSQIISPKNDAEVDLSVAPAFESVVELHMQKLIKGFRIHFPH